MFLHSPLNYTGGKYKLLPQILPLFPKKIDTFVDLFAGGCNVAINVDAARVVANDINRPLMEIYNYFQSRSAEKLLVEIDAIIEEYELSWSSKYGYEKYGSDSSRGLGAYNKEAYMKLRADYNASPSPLMLYVTLLFAFNNQIRFNSKGAFNTPVNKRDFNKSLRKNFLLFVKKINTTHIEFSSYDFRELEISDDSFVYIDPPYLATMAAYNENGGWSEEKEQELLLFMDSLDARGVKFALSNVFENKDKKNNLLLEWSKKYRVHPLTHTYHNCNYQAKNKTKNSTKEVLITNY